MAPTKSPKVPKKTVRGVSAVGMKQEKKQTIVRHGKKTSEVWNYFQSLEDIEGENPRSMCNICGEVFKCPGGSTTGMRGHLDRKHPGLLTSSTSMVLLKDHKESKNLTLNEQDLPLAFSGTLRSNSHIPATMEQHEETSRAIALMCVMDLRPVGVIEKDGFRGMMSYFADSYVLAILSGQVNFKSVPDVINEMYLIESDRVKNDLKEKFICLTVELWNKTNLEKFIFVTAHFVSEDWKLESRLLGARLVPDSSESTSIINTSSANGSLLSAIMNVLNTFMIQKEQIVTMLFYSLPSEQPESDIGNFLTIPCLNDIIGNCYEKLRDLVKTTVGYDFFENALSVATKYLPNLVTLKRNPYALFESLLSRRSSLEVLEPITIPWDHLPAFTSLLSPVNDLVDVLLDEINIPLSTVLPILYALRDQCFGLVEDLDDVSTIFTKEVAQEFVNVILHTFQNSYRFEFNSEDFSESLLAICTFLDPRYKGLKFFNDDQRQSVYDAILALLSEFEGIPTHNLIPKDLPDASPKIGSEVDLNCTSSPSAEASEVESILPTLEKAVDSEDQKSPRKRHRLSKLTVYLMKVLGKKKESAPSTETTMEVQQYLIEPVPSLATNPLTWWKCNSNRFLNLSAIAMKFLGVPGLATNAELIFTEAGAHFEHQRTEIESEYVDKIMFLHKHYTTTLSSSESIPISSAPSVECKLENMNHSSNYETSHTESV